MKNYYIYHIPGIKIGCTQDVPHRMREQQFTEWEHLETHTDIYEASTRELELQAEFGLPIDKIPYWQAVENRYKWNSETAGEAGSIGGRANVESGHLKSISSLGGKVGGKIGGKIAGKINGKKNAAKISTCEHCGKTGKYMAMIRYHFNNCKQKNETI